MSYVDCMFLCINNRLYLLDFYPHNLTFGLYDSWQMSCYITYSFGVSKVDKG